MHKNNLNQHYKILCFDISENNLETGKFNLCLQYLYSSTYQKTSDIVKNEKLSCK
jgi:hypothetical protein